ncbi:hypothetical protein F5Y16DRAFT_331045 [Xylariaceae sp. FL0255]|nr:hypothetical protein F5Y16DRAFT_331045 [Xylariaceae sp. FL0255]
MGDTIHLTGLSPVDAIHVVIALVALAAAFVVARIVAPLVRSRKLFPEDYMSLVGLIALSVTTAADAIFLQDAENPNITALFIIRVTIVINVFLDLSVWLCKTPLLLLYIRMFGVKDWVRFSCYAVLGLSFIPAAAGVIANAVVCTPHSSTSVSDSKFKACEHVSPLWNVIIGFVSVFVDFFLLVLPMPILFNLQLTLRKRLGLIILFSTGLIALAASIVALYYKWVQLYQGSGSVLTPIFSTVESAVALIVAAVPPLASVYTKVATTNLYSRLRESVSRSLGLLRTRSRQTSHSGQSDREDYNAPYEYIHNNKSMKVGQDIEMSGDLAFIQRERSKQSSRKDF